MKNQNLSRSIQKIQDLIAKTNEISDIEMQSHWARYVCVRCSGVLEMAIRELYGEYANTCANEGVAKYVKWSLSQIYTPKQTLFLDTAERFNPAWKNDLETFLIDDGRGDAVDSIVNTRNSVAHGGNSSITIATLKTYFAKAIKVLEFIETQCNSTIQGKNPA
jgi:hypothetical protein